MSVKLKALQAVAGTTAAAAAGGGNPEAISFDGGSNGDKLAISTNLSGSSNSQTFTISFWFWGKDNFSGRVISAGQAGYISAYVYHSGFQFEVKDSSNTVFVDLTYAPGNSTLQESWNHIIWSMDTINGDWKIYLNDRDISGQVNTNSKSMTGTPYWNSGNFSISGAAGGNFEFEGRLAHVFADFKYRDLDVDSNRRLFITEDKKPVTSLTSVDSYSANSTTVSVANIQGTLFNDDGSKFYYVSSTNDAIYEYDLTTNYDVSSKSSSAADRSKSLIRIDSNDNPTSATWSADGTKLFVFYQTANVISTWTTSTAFDVTGLSEAGASNVASFFTGVRAGDFNSDGTKLFAVGLDSTVIEFSHSAYSFSTSTNTSHDFGLTSLSGIRFNSNGTKLFLNSSGTFYEYALSTAYDLTTASLTNTYTFSAASYAQFTFNDNGTKLVVGHGGTSVFTIDLNTGYDLSTAAYGIEDGNPTQPIVYVPATDVTDAGSNLGSGGDLNVIGTLDQAESGPNQNNTYMSRFNGTDERLYKSITASSIANTTVTTLSFIGRPYNSRNNQYIIHPVRSNDGAITFLAMFEAEKLWIWSYDRVASQTGFQGTVPAPVGQMHHWAISIDTSSQTNTKVFRDGVEQTITWVTWNNNSTISYNIANMINIGSNNTPSAFLDGAIGELYWDDSYIDLSSNNIFWDSDTNKPKSLKQVLDETGNNPLVAMPLNAAYPQENLGSIGDFIDVGAKDGHIGMSEHISRSVQSAGGYSNRLSLSVSHTMGQELSLVMGIRENGFFTGDFTMFKTDPLNFHTSNHRVNAFVYDTTSSRVFSNNDPDNLQEEKWYVAFISINLADTTVNNNEVRLHGNNTVEDYSLNYDGVYNSSNNLKAITSIEAIYQQDNFTVQGGAIYFTDTFIDFKQEANRNKFLNQMGYLKNLEAEIEAGNIPEPLVYLPMDDSSNYGKNLGTLNDFTVNGTLTQGPDIDITNR